MKAFISSTFRDLVPYRRAVAESLERLGHQAGQMEVFGARPEGAQEVCRKEIKECDLFIGVYAYRYGFIPPESQNSITEQEFDYAKELLKPIFCFIIDEDHPWPPKLVEAEPGSSKLNDFKSRIRNTLVVDTYTTPEDLAYKVSTSVSNYLTQRSTLAKVAAPDAAGTALARPVEERVEIQAPAQNVWDVLMNPKWFPKWASFIHRCGDSVGEDGSLAFRTWPFGMKATLKIVEVEPGRELCWLRYFPRIAKSNLSIRYLFRLETLDTSVTSLIQEEKFDGDMGDIFWVLSLFGSVPRASSRRMNYKIKLLAERNSQT